MGRWTISEILGAGIALMVGGMGGIVLMGLWVITQRDAALVAGAETWAIWDRALVLWAYGAVVALLGLAVAIGLWWWRRIGRGLLSIQEAWRGLLWEDRRPSGPLPVPFQEAEEPVRALLLFQEVLALWQEIGRGERNSLPPQSTAWPPALQETFTHILAQLTWYKQRHTFWQALWQKGLDMLRLAQRETDLARYLERVGPAFLQAIGATMGAYYHLEGGRLRRIYQYAYPPEAPDFFQIGEGWIGQAAREGQALWLADLPSGYVEVLSGLGRVKPRAVAVLPLIAGESIHGVWDLASLSEWEPAQQEAAQMLSGVFSAGILLVEEAQKEAQFQAQLHRLQAEVAQKATEYQALAQQWAALEDERRLLTQTLTEKQALLQQVEKRTALEEVRWQLVVSHLSEAFLFFDAVGRPRYFSPSITSLLGYLPHELEVFFRYIDKADIQEVRDFFAKLLRSPGETILLRFRYLHKKGHTVWLEAQACNYLQEPAVQAILVVLRDVSTQVEYEKQYRTRLKFQSLVENSTDIIFRLDRTGTFLYANPTIERYTGYSPAHYIRNTIYSVGFSLQEVQFWEGFIREVFEGMQVTSAEIDFPSIYGTRRMMVRGIPEVGPEGEVETLVVLLQDITELRQVQQQLHQQNLRLEQARIELERQKEELEERNRDIMESITYARRIQGALIPGEEGLRALFPDSFVLHWLRDVVGGDFYWYGESEGQIIVAVVDCTEHGVPGAFMTFLGYTLLEGAIRERKLTDPAGILYDMDGRLRELLAGQENIQDGMDVALCVIDSRRQIVRFAGAHRPLLMQQEGRWLLVAGAPTGLGGALWLEEVKTFTTHTFSYRPGDLLYLYTDGYPDQFGGGGKRYTHRRFRQQLAVWASLPMQQQRERLLEELRAWMGDTPPTDDITVLGLRL